ncbi:hypothetical protein FB45DRAFT_1017181 [Roridomyces roridus]|uniref:Uncharacterized protein n=1 Tax=Roridomyces roridus TaxID=1738132 RepID=A0AAD7FY89_9AGAR|nr:hypothetical protein FB45DRAFT_1017181 [Roridomyces roridus]
MTAVRATAVAVNGRVGALGLSTCELLSAMLLPNLEKFEIGWDESPDPSKAVISFLDASDCHLKYLSIPQTGYRSASLISILESPHVRDIVRLDICHVSGSMYIPFFLAELSKNGQLAPQLRTLAIRGDSRDMDEFNVLELLANRKPTIRRVLSWEFEERERDLVNDGLEVVVRDR